MAQKTLVGTELVVQNTCEGHVGKPAWVAERPSLAASFMFSNMRSGHLPLFEIFSFVAGHPAIVTGNNPSYSSLRRKILEGVPEESGWYFWGRFNQYSKWECLYVGKSERRERAHLRARITEELWDERVAFWAFVFGRTKAFLDNRHAYNGRWDKEAKRAIRKSDSNFIIWVSDPSCASEEIRQEEKNLIYYYEALGNQEIGENNKTVKTRRICKLVEYESKKILGVNS